MNEGAILESSCNRRFATLNDFFDAHGVSQKAAYLGEENCVTLASRDGRIEVTIPDFIWTQGEAIYARKITTILSPKAQRQLDGLKVYLPLISWSEALGEVIHRTGKVSVHLFNETQHQQINRGGPMAREKLYVATDSSGKIVAVTLDANMKPDRPKKFAERFAETLRLNTQARLVA